MEPTRPCAGLRVVELAVGTSEVGLGLAAALPGMLLRDLGADVVRVTGTAPCALDEGLPWARAWHRGKELVRTDDVGEVRALLEGADAVLAYGPEELVEGRGLGAVDLPSHLVYARCRPSRTSTGGVGDHALLVEAASGFCSQLAGHRSGPIFIDVRASGLGAGALLTVEVLALLRRRALGGGGGWGETSLYDGLLATLGCMLGRSERAAPAIESYWQKGSTFPNFLYRCQDGDLLQVWFGGKGMYGSLLEVLGDEPSDQGYYSDQMSGRLQERAQRWKDMFPSRPRAEWVQRLRAAGVACEPVNGPGEALRDPHLAEIGLAVRDGDGVVVGTPLAVRPLADAVLPAPPAPGPGGLLSGLRVVDFSAYVAGPLAAEVLADLGADVVKVEPPEGEAMRAAAYAVAACQRGKRSLALDLGDPATRPVVEELLRTADVVVHNFRVGVAERLGIDEETVARLNPGAVYCHATAFGSTGPRARLPGNDALVQAVSGVEAAAGGRGNDPLCATWIPVDMAGGWLAAAGVLAGLYARATTGRGQRVASSLLGAGMVLHSGVSLRDGALVLGPELDGAQTGYGPGYRLYPTADDAWIAVVVPDVAAWDALRTLPGAGALPVECAPLRGCGRDDAAEAAEAVLEKALAALPQEEALRRLTALGVLATPVVDTDRDGFRRGVLDDPVNRQLGRVATYPTPDWGRFEQVGPLLRTGPAPSAGPRLALPRVGEHTVEVLRGLGVPDAQVQALLDGGAARQLEG